jgi:hypothetical protein
MDMRMIQEIALANRPGQKEAAKKLFGLPDVSSLKGAFAFV